MRLETHLGHIIKFSCATWGPHNRRKGVIDHIRKELVEIEHNPDDGRASNEWVDVLILAVDGLWRELAAEGVPLKDIPSHIAYLWDAKQRKNEARAWPDWRTADPDKAIEHVRQERLEP